MDLTKITDEKELKSLAYDQLVAKATSEQNLTAINQRLQELAQTPVEPAKSK